MDFKFKPFKAMSSGETVSISKELHKLIDVASLERCGRFVLQEMRENQEIRVDLLLSADRPYVVRIVNSTRAYSREPRLSFVVGYAKLDTMKLEEIGLLVVDGLNCADSEEDV